MKKVEAVIRPGLVEQVRIALQAKGFVGMTKTECVGTGSGSNSPELTQAVKIEIVVPATSATAVAATIMLASRTGERGDGVIFISSVEGVVRVRTGEQDAEALI